MNYTREWFAQKGAKGGSSTSAAKRASSRANLMRTPTHRKRSELSGAREIKMPNLPGPKDIP